MRTFLDVFPEGQGWLLWLNVDAPVLGLVGSLEARAYSAQWIEGRLSDAKLESELKKLALADSVRFFGSLLAGPASLRDFAGGAPLNTDDHPQVMFGTPRFVYQKEATSYGRLMELLSVSKAEARVTLRIGAGPEGEQFARRLADFTTARDLYLRGLVEESEGRSAQAVNAFVESARRSGDFTLGYAQCLTIASLQAKSNPEVARTLLLRLVAAQPTRGIAREMLERLPEK